MMIVSLIEEKQRFRKRRKKEQRRRKPLSKAFSSIPFYLRHKLERQTLFDFQNPLLSDCVEQKAESWRKISLVLS